MEEVYKASWSAQYDRMSRWYIRLTNNKRGSIADDKQYLDFLYSFFITCWHLKDWIKNDPGVNIKNNIIEDFCNKSKPLRICRDITQTHKHLLVTDPDIDKSLKIDGGTVLISFWEESDEPPEMRLHFTIFSDTSGERTDAFELASSCKKEWDKFISKHNLIRGVDPLDLAMDLLKERLDKSS